MKRILLLPFISFFLFSVAISFSQDVQQENNSDKKEVKKYDAEASKKLLSSPTLSLDEIKKLVELGANVNAVTGDNSTVLHNYISANDPAIIKYLIEQGANVNTKNVTGRTPLDLAVMAVKIHAVGGNVTKMPYDQKKASEVIKVLVANGADIFAFNRLNSNPINTYLERSHGRDIDFDLVKSLLNKDNINKKDRRGRTPLHSVLFSKPETLEVLKYICEDCNADVNLPDNNGVTPIHLAAMSSNVDVVTLLIKKGADISIVNRYGKSGLHILIENTSKDVIKEIITQNKINVADAYKGTDSPLHTGMRQGMNLERMKIFLEVGVPINSRNKSNQTPLHLAAMSPQYEEILKFFLNNAADINAEDDNGKTPLHYAASSRFDTTNIIKILIDKKANVNAKDKNAQTPLLEILTSVRPPNVKFELVKLLIDKKAEIDIKDKNLSTPLHIALSSKQWEINLIQYLIEKGININAQNNDGQTALTILLERIEPNNRQNQQISRQECYKMLKFFIEHGADISIKDKNNTTIFETIIKNNLPIEPDIFKKLITGGKDIDWSKCKDTSPVCWALSNGAGHEALEYFSKGNADFTMKNNGMGPLTTLFHYMNMNNQDIINFETVKYLVERGSDVNDRFPPLQQTPLLFALGRNNPDIEIVKYLLDKGADIHAKDNRGLGTLHSAILIRPSHNVKEADNYEQKFFDIVKYLVERGADVNLTDKAESALPIHLAAMMGSEKIVRYLAAKQKAKLNVKTSNGSTLLHCALKGLANIDLVKFLIQNDCSVNDKDINGKTPFHYAVMNTQISLDIVKYLCEEAHAEINVRDNLNNTPLISAVQFVKKLEIIKYLIERGADVNAVNNNRGNAIHYLFMLFAPLDNYYTYNLTKGRIVHKLMDVKSTCDLISILVDKGVNINCKDKHGKTPLHYATLQNSTVDTEIISFFIKKGADIYAKDNNGKTALFIFLLCGSGTYDVSGVLKIFDINSNKEKYKTLLHEFIIAANNINMGDAVVTRVQAIVKAGAPINAKDKFGSTPLHVAVGRNMGLQVVKCLIENGADVNAKDNNNATPLHDAAEYCSIPEVLDILIKTGADVNAKDIFGMTPLDLLGTENRSAKETILQNKIKQDKIKQKDE
ncbi:MAG: ankyrin repeat domain-containing protein [Planctomycetaceae bacterium]|jgi:ankyrin repeat protein|nr:ankyrin repeat domain-containing protein [Planctomycetaceae bacterium]